MFSATLATLLIVAGCAEPGADATTGQSPAAGAAALDSSTASPDRSTSSSGPSPAISSPSAPVEAPRTSTSSAPPASSSAPSSSAPSNTPVYGTPGHPIKVQVTGQVVASSKGKVVMCPPFPVAADGVVGGTEPQTPSCQGGVPISGVDVENMSDPGRNSAGRWGQIHIEASWDGHSLTVLTQRKTTKADDQPFVDQPVTCPAPAAGWKVGSTQDDPGIDKIAGAVGAAYGGLAMGYPHGGPTNVDGTNPSYGLQDTEQVVVVGVTGDIAAATAKIRAVFKGNLCVVHSDLTDAEAQRQEAALTAAIGGEMGRYGMISWSVTQKALGVPGPIEIDAVVDTPTLEHLASTIPGPPIKIVPWIQPIA